MQYQQYLTLPAADYNKILNEWSTSHFGDLPFNTMHTALKDMGARLAAFVVSAPMMDESPNTFAPTPTSDTSVALSDTQSSLASTGEAEKNS